MVRNLSVVLNETSASACDPLSVFLSDGDRLNLWSLEPDALKRRETADLGHVMFVVSQTRQQMSFASICVLLMLPGFFS